MSDDELDRLVKYLQTAPSMAARNAATAITTLRARIAELEADRAEWVGEREESIRRGARRTPGRFRL